MSNTTPPTQPDRFDKGLDRITKILALVTPIATIITTTIVCVKAPYEIDKSRQDLAIARNAAQTAASSASTSPLTTPSVPPSHTVGTSPHPIKMMDKSHHHVAVSSVKAADPSASTSSTPESGKSPDLEKIDNDSNMSINSWPKFSIIAFEVLRRLGYLFLAFCFGSGAFTAFTDSGGERQGCGARLFLTFSLGGASIVFITKALSLSVVPEDYFGLDWLMAGIGSIFLIAMPAFIYLRRKNQ